MALTPQEVFRPGSFPTHTYVARAEDDFESHLQHALTIAGQLISISGPSKSGKTVLVEKVVGIDQLIVVTGAGIVSPEDIWRRALKSMDAPLRKTGSTGQTTLTGASGGVSGTIKLPLVAEGQASLGGKAESTRSSQQTVEYAQDGLHQMIREIGNSDYVLLIDDFHYMPRQAQEEAAKVLKEAVRSGVKVCVASVPHRGDDVVRANPELRGRVHSIDLKYWKDEDLAKIADAGFGALNVTFNTQLIRKLAGESAGSPQLMQLVCLNACHVANVRSRPLLHREIALVADDINRIFEITSTNTDFRSMVDVLDAGPRTRGTERRMYSFRDSTEGDVYRCMLKAIAMEPPRLAFDYDELVRRAGDLCVGDPPIGSSVVSTCSQLAKLAQLHFPNERAIDWDENKQIIDIADPNFLFYLRWSGRLLEAN